MQRELFRAVTECKECCSSSPAKCSDDAVHALDEAVAFYVGSQHAVNNLGNLPYGLAERRCRNYATCTNITSGVSKVNVKVMQQFNALKTKFIGNDCSQTQEGVDEVVRLMMIPLIQATLRYAYLTSATVVPTEAQQTEAAIFAAGILPKVHECDAAAAATIYENVKLNNMMSKANFPAVKAAFESVYECLKVTCEEVGGLVNTTTRNTYVSGAGPCGNVSSFL